MGWASAAPGDQESHEEDQQSNPKSGANGIVQHRIEESSDIGGQWLHLTRDAVHGMRDAAAQGVRD